MDQQNKTKPEENQNKSTELSDKELEQVTGGAIAPIDNPTILPTGAIGPIDNPLLGVIGPVDNPTLGVWAKGKFADIAKK